jgi:hypothetical protein
MFVKFPTGIWRVDSFGRWYPNIQGGEGPEDEGTDDGADDEEGPQKPKTFTQKDLDRHSSIQKREGKKQANKELMEKFDFESIDQLEEFIKSARERSEKSDDDSDKRLKRLEERERKADEKVKEATRKANQADVVAHLVSEGLSRSEARRAARLVELDLNLDDLEDDDIVAAIDELKAEMPRLFATVEEDDEEKDPPRRRTPDSTPRGQKPKKTVGADMQERGNARLLARHGDKLKSA